MVGKKKEDIFLHRWWRFPYSCVLHQSGKPSGHRPHATLAIKKKVKVTSLRAHSPQSLVLGKKGLADELSSYIGTGTFLTSEASQWLYLNPIIVRSLLVFSLSFVFLEVTCCHLIASIGKTSCSHTQFSGLQE